MCLVVSQSFSISSPPMCLTYSIKIKEQLSSSSAFVFLKFRCLLSDIKQLHTSEINSSQNEQFIWDKKIKLIFFLLELPVTFCRWMSFEGQNDKKDLIWNKWIMWINSMYLPLTFLLNLFDHEFGFRYLR